MLYPEGTLGSELGLFLHRHNFELMDKLEDHDVFHVLLDVDTTVKGEAIMQWILIGNGKRSLFGLFSGLLSWIMLPEYRKEMKENYIRGKNMHVIYKWQFQYLLREPLSLLKNMLHSKQKIKTNKNIKPIRF